MRQKRAKILPKTQQPTTSPAQPPDWAAIKSAYLAATTTVATLCTTHAITQRQLYHRAKKDGWPPRSKTKPIAPPPSPQRRAPSRTNPAPTLQEALEFITMDLMHRIQTRTSETSADHDKDARTLSSLVRTYEKLKDIKAISEGPANRDQQADTDTKGDPDDQRRQIAARLEKLINAL